MASVKDVGITISLDLSWTSQVDEVVNKATKVLGLIKRAISSFFFFCILMIFFTVIQW